MSERDEAMDRIKASFDEAFPPHPPTRELRELFRDYQAWKRAKEMGFWRRTFRRTLSRIGACNGHG